MTNKEYDIIKQFIQVFVDAAYTRCALKLDNEKYGFITMNDVNDLLQRIHVLVEDEAG